MAKNIRRQLIILIGILVAILIGVAYAGILAEEAYLGDFLSNGHHLDNAQRYVHLVRELVTL